MMRTALLLLLLWPAACWCQDADEVPAWKPVAGDLFMFPDAATAATQLELATRHAKWLELWDAPEDWRSEAWDRRRAWDYLDGAHRLNVAGGHNTMTETYLGYLLNNLGYQRYFAGAMPPPVPVERFRRLP
jgi:hypothetical protein